jgi:YidC/Oxa1 family membrane protein insertase
VEKRLMLALLLSAGVLLLWPYLFPQPERPPRTEPAPAVGAPQDPGAPASPERAGEPSGEISAQDLGPILGEPVADGEERTLELLVGTPGEVGSYRARFTNRGARLLQLQLGDSYDRPRLGAEEKLDPEHWTSLVESRISGGVPTGSMTLVSEASSRDLERAPLDRALWRMREIERGVEFDLAQGTGVRWIKRIVFQPGSYDVRVTLEIENQALDGSRKLGYLFCPAEVMPLESGDRYYIEPQAIAAGRSREDAQERTPLPEARSVQREDGASELSGGFAIPEDEIAFAGVHNKYFAMLMRGADPYSVASIASARWRRLRDDELSRSDPDVAAKPWRYVATDLVLALDLPARGERKVFEYVVYAGPKRPEPLLASDADHEALLNLDLGTFLCLPMDFIGNALLFVMRSFHRVVGNWGVAIILMTLLVRALLFPVNRRSQTAMARFQKKMKRLQPQLDEIKKRHADDPQKAREEQQKVTMREGLVPPLGGCLPVFVQIPIFFGLFSALRTAFELRHAPFALWIDDLSQPDALLELGWDTHLPLIGTIDHLNLLPILMIVLWVLQQRLMPTPTDEQAARMQKMMMFMPIVMGVFLYDYAAGLSLYMITQSGLGIVEQTLIKRLWPVDDTEPVKSTSKTFFQRMMERAQEAQRLQQGRQRDQDRKKGGKKKR